MEDFKSAITSMGVMAPSAMALLQLVLIMRGYSIAETETILELASALMNNLAVLGLSILALWGRLRADKKIGGIFTV